MSYLTASEVTTLRTRPTSTKLYLSIYQPPTVFAGQINGLSTSRGFTILPYDNVTSGSWSGVVPGETLLVGSKAGLADLGRVRVRDATGIYIHVADSDDVQYGDNVYLTVIGFHELDPIYVSILDGVTDADDDLIFYPDGDIHYTNQNSILGSFVCMGSNYAGFSEDPVFYSATGTVNVKADTVSYLWTFEGGNPASSVAETPGYVSYAVPGHYTTTLEVTSSSGAVDVSYRHISIYNHSTNKPIQQWTMQDFTGSRDEGGYSAKFTVYEPISYITDGTLIVIFAEDTYGDSVISLGGNSLNRNKIVFVGYVVENSITYDYNSHTTSFTAENLTGLMKRKENFSISVDDSKAPTKWQQLLNMNMKKAFFYYFRWYSTATQIADFRYLGEDMPLQYFEADASSLYDTVNKFMQTKTDGQIVCDRQGLIWAESGLALQDGIMTGVYPVGFDLQKQDWLDKPSVDKIIAPQISLMNMGGFCYAGAATGTNTPYLADAPGHKPAHYGTAQQGSAGLILIDQTDLNKKIGNKYAYMISQYPQAIFKLAGGYRNLEIVPYEKVLVTVSADDTNQGIVFNQKPFHITDMALNYNSEKSALLSEVTLHEITQGVPGETVEIPQTPDNGYPDYPLIPWNDYPIFGGFPVPFVPNLNIDPCSELFSGVINSTGPFYLPSLNGEYAAPDIVSKKTVINAYVRGGGASDRTSYMIEGLFQHRDTTAVTLGAWINDTAIDWYAVYALDAAGNRVATATNEATTSYSQRTGYFTVSPGITVAGIELEITADDPQIYDFDFLAPGVQGNVILGHTLTMTQVNKAKVKVHGEILADTYWIYWYVGGSFAPLHSGAWTNKWFEYTIDQYQVEVFGTANLDAPGVNSYDSLGRYYASHTSSFATSHTSTTFMVNKGTFQQRQGVVGVEMTLGVGADSDSHHDPYADPAPVKIVADAEISMVGSKRIQVYNFSLYNICSLPPATTSTSDSTYINRYSGSGGSMTRVNPI